MALGSVNVGDIQKYVLIKVVYLRGTDSQTFYCIKRATDICLLFFISQ